MEDIRTRLVESSDSHTEKLMSNAAPESTHKLLAHNMKINGRVMKTGKLFTLLVFFDLYNVSEGFFLAYKSFFVVPWT